MKFTTPYTLILAGPSGSGKTTMLANILRYKESLHSRPPRRVYYFHSGVTQLGSDIRSHITRALPEMCTTDWVRANVRPEDHALIIMDDLATSITADTIPLFTVMRHHLNVSFVLVVHNVFTNNPHFRTISLNAQMMCLFKNPRDSSSIVYLSRQLAPAKSRSFQEAYYDAVSRPFGYLFVDLQQETDEDERLHTNLFEENGLPTYRYVLT